MQLIYENGEHFSSGIANYNYRPITEREETNRIIISVILDDIKTLAFVDTGGAYVICSPEIAEELNLDPKGGIIVDSLLWRNEKLKGSLHRVPMTIVADEGKSLRIEPTIFVPQLEPYDIWEKELTCILGMHSCLDRLRFAVDPSTDSFYFGKLG
ncbi:MAG: hypothetical protein PVG14_06520 [Anaerolineales bacterium]|jgi:hypothetical protein